MITPILVTLPAASPRDRGGRTTFQSCLFACRRIVASRYALNLTVLWLLVALLTPVVIAQDGPVPIRDENPPPTGVLGLRLISVDPPRRAGLTELIRVPDQREERPFVEVPGDNSAVTGDAEATAWQPPVSQSEILGKTGANQPPIAIPDVYTTLEGVPLVVTAPGHLANDFDPDGDPITWLSYTVPQDGTMSGTASDGSFTYTPDPGFSGIEQMTYAISDGNGGIAFGELLIVVPDDQNRPPVAVPDVYTTPEGVALVVSAPGHLGNDTDADGDPITWLSYTVPQHGTMSGTASDGTFTYTPDPGFSGLEQMTYAISDGSGGIAFGELLILVVDDQNLPPVAVPDVFTTSEGVSLVVSAPGHLGNDTDADGDPITWLSYTVPQHGTMSGTASNGSFTYTPDPGFSGIEQITYAISDGNGGIAFGELLIHVLPSSETDPVAVSDVYTTPENVPLVVAAPGHLGNDFDPNGDPIAWLSYTVPQHGTMSGTASNGSFTYTPDPGFSGLEQMTYAISDGNGGIAFGELLIFVLDDQNLPPVAVPDVFTTSQGVPLVVSAPGHLGNDTDADGDPITWLSYTVPQHGTMSGTASDGTFTYTPDPGFSGLEQMTYAISDGNGGIAFGELLILVVGDQNRPPVAIPDVFITLKDVPLVVAAPGHLGNDTDADGDPIVWLSYTVPQDGTMSGTASNGSFTYTPDPGFTGLEQMTYAISDGNGGIAFGELLIAVVETLPEPPVCDPADDAYWDGTVVDIGGMKYLRLVAPRGWQSIEFWNTSNLSVDGIFAGDGTTDLGADFSRTGDTFSYTGPGGPYTEVLVKVSPIGAGTSQFYIKLQDLGPDCPIIDIDPVIALDAERGETPAAFALEQNYPNPFNPSTTIAYALAERSEVRLSVVDVLGREVRTLDLGSKEAGAHRVTFDGEGLPSGVYLYRLEAGSHVSTRRMTLLK